MLYLSKKFGINRDSLFFTLVFILASLANLNYAVIQDSSIIDTFLLLIISALLVVQFLKSPKIPAFKLSELGCLLLVAYLIFKNIFANTFDVSSVSYLAFFVTLYYGLNFFFTLKKFSAYSLTLCIATGTILFTYLAFAIYHCYFQKETLTNIFFPNKSIFSILLASQIAFVLPIWHFYKNKKIFSKPVNRGFLALITASFVLLVSTQGRAGCIGFVLALAYTGYKYLSASRVKRIVLYSVFALLTTAMFLYKSGSSSGRLLIYKVSKSMLKDNWLWGIGQGQFKIHYNQYQASYFASNNIDSKEALLADNSFYSFNDYFQILIENGLIAFLLLISTLLLLVIQIKKPDENPDNMHLFTASIASFICILTGSLFSYSLQIFPIAVQATFCLCIINSFQSEKKLQVEIPEKGNKIAKCILILLSILLLIHFSFYFNYKRKSNQAFELKRSGFRQKAIEKYRNLSNSYLQEGKILYFYAQELYYTNQLTQAQETLNKVKKLYCTNDVYKLSADIETELQNYVQAEADYKKAIYMVPNRMISRNELFRYYLERKDTANAIYWANSILNMSVKVPSQKTKNIQQKVRKVLEGLKN
jgi:O-antigen ligase